MVELLGSSNNGDMHQFLSARLFKLNNNGNKFVDGASCLRLINTC